MRYITHDIERLETSCARVNDHNFVAMAPTVPVPPAQARSWLSAAPHVARFSATTSSAVLLARRDLSVNDAQKVTLGIIAAYVVAIALLWNLPYVRWVLWPFKVRSPLPSSLPLLSHPLLSLLPAGH